MKASEEKAIYRKAIETFGVDEQLNIAKEECAELIKALSKHHRVSKFESYDKRKVQRAVNHVLEELVDVEIMLEQIQMIYGFSGKRISESKEFKLQRLENNLTVFKGEL